MVHLRKLVAALAALVIGSLSVPALASGYAPRVEDEFFGISAPGLYTLSGEGRTQELDAQMTAIKAAGLDWVRAEIGWAETEPQAPVGGVHRYDWTRADRFVRSLASKGLTAFPMLMGTPRWARSPAAIAAGCGRAAGVSPLHAADYGAWAGALIERFGPGGHFWRDNPDLTPHPITRVEFYNEPNWTGFWCPGPDPVAYGLAVKAAGSAIHQVEPETTVVGGGLVAVKPGDDAIARGLGVDVDGFLATMVATSPGLTGEIDAFAVHLYHPDPDVDIGLLSWFRHRLDAAGLANAEIVVNEFGWRTGGGGSDVVTETTRASLIKKLSGEFARTDCGVTAVAPHTWSTPEIDANDPEHWYGITDPETGGLYPSATAYRNEVALYEGRGSTPAPRETIRACSGPDPDTDGDGTPDEDDDYPTDPDRNTGSGEDPPEPPRSPRPNYGPRVESDFFGVTISELPWSELRLAHLDSIPTAGISEARVMVDWSHLQPNRSGPIRWEETDTIALQLAKRGIGIAPFFGRPPQWAISSGSWQQHYLAILEAYARRYGPGGVFWQENGHLDEGLAQDQVEISPVGNSQAHWWGGAVSPGGYADLYLAARQALLRASPENKALISVFDEGDRGRAGSFVRSMAAAKPELAGALDGVYVYSNQPSQARLDETLADLRSALDDTGNQTTAIHAGFGWSTHGPFALTETARAATLAEFASRLSRSDCGIERVVPYSWLTNEAPNADAWGWYGISSPEDASLRPTALAYRDQIRAYTGFGQDPPPRSPVHICGLPEPDRDGDGVPDSEDDFPIDPGRFDGVAPTLTTSLRLRSQGKKAIVRFSARDSSGIASRECALDQRPLAPCSSPWTLANLRRGPHKVVVRVTDTSGNRSTAVERWRTQAVSGA